jgi:Flp pilus assembly protein TadG
MHVSVLWKLRGFLSDRKGNVGMMFGIALLPILAMVGSAVDYARIRSYQSRVQASLDGAVLAGAAQSVGSRDATATNAFVASVPTNSIGTVSIPTFVTNADQSYSGTVQGSVGTSIMGVVGINSIALKVSSTAIPPSVPTPGRCMIALNPATKSAMDDSGGTKVNPACVVQVNSSDSKAVTLSGSAAVTSKENCIVGGVSTSGDAVMNPPPDASCQAFADPFAAMVKPAVGSCDFVGFTQSNFVGSVYPGTYCNGMNFSNGTITFAPGLYIITNGTLQTSGSATLYGNGVSFYFTGNNTGVNFSGGTNIKLIATSSGILAGFVFYLDSSGKPNKSSQLSGGSQLYYEGVIYMPGQNINLSGESAGSSVSPFTAYVADTFTFSGSAQLDINADATKTSVPIPVALKGKAGGGLRLAY